MATVCGSILATAITSPTASRASSRRSGALLKWHFAVDGTILFKHACALGSEGETADVRSGRIIDWLKIKNPPAPAAKREAEEDCGDKRRACGRLL
jgi:hypothetical protein